MRLFPRENYHPREHRLPLRSRAGLQLLLVVSEPGDLAPVLQVRAKHSRQPCASKVHQLRASRFQSGTSNLKSLRCDLKLVPQLEVPLSPQVLLTV